MPRIVGPRHGDPSVDHFYFMAAKHFHISGHVKHLPNRRAEGRPVDARRPTAFTPRKRRNTNRTPKQKRPHQKGAALNLTKQRWT